MWGYFCLDKFDTFVKRNSGGKKEYHNKEKITSNNSCRPLTHRFSGEWMDAGIHSPCQSQTTTSTTDDRWYYSAEQEQFEHRSTRYRYYYSIILLGQ